MEQKTGAELIAEERKRQIEVEGWTSEHDDQHSVGAMAAAGAAYAANYAGADSAALDLWPWEWKWWKPTPNDPVRQLVKAGALIAAEIDRLQRQVSHDVLQARHDAMDKLNGKYGDSNGAGGRYTACSRLT